MVKPHLISAGRRSDRRRERAALTTELLVAMALLVLAVCPLAYAFSQEVRLLRGSYWRSVVMEIVDGEAEILAAGEWRAFPEGQQPYTVRAGAATNLPPGRFQLTKTGKQLRLEWRSDERQSVGPVVRDITIQ
ncbi:MAG: hypothetical protein KJ070_18455 [Verrucomicrobia bacterium]|nr:hypothetical protein [Verrucomicrobiota bacterium]